MVAAGMLLALVIGGVFPMAASAMPPDPQRPFQATTCDGAKARLEESLGGSSLISAEEMTEVIVTAGEWVTRLCGPDIAEEMMNGFNTKEK